MLAQAVDKSWAQETEGPKPLQVFDGCCDHQLCVVLVTEE